LTEKRIKFQILIDRKTYNISPLRDSR